MVPRIFSSSYSDIYFEELEHEKENKDLQTSLLGLSKEVHGRKLSCLIKEINFSFILFHALFG